VDNVPAGQGLAGLGWSPDSQSYAYARRQYGTDEVRDDLLLVRPDGSTTLMAAGLNGPVTLRWVDSVGFIFHGAIGGTWGLIYQGLGGVQQMQAATSSSLTFDVRR
jgi:hypothetical protein